MKVLVTGGAGFIGSHFCDHLLALNAHVCALDDLSLGREENLAHLRDNPSFVFHRANLLDAPALNALFERERFDLVVHLAANSDISRSHEMPEVDLNNTFLTTYRVLDAMRRHGPTQVIFASTSAIYGDADVALREDHGPLFPVSHYGAAKLAGEAFLSSFAENYGIRSWIVRFPNVVGGRATHGVIYDFIQRLRQNPKQLEVLGDGNQEKPYMHVTDLVGAIWFVHEHAGERTNVFNVSVPTRTTVREIAERVVGTMGLSASIVYAGGDRGWVGDVPRFQYDTTRIRELGWRANMESSAAVQRAIEENLR